MQMNEQATLITRSSRAGFFSDFFWALEGIKIASDNDLFPFVHFGPKDCENPQVCADMNGWSWSDFFVSGTQKLALPRCSALSRIGGTVNPSGGTASSLEALRQTFQSQSGFNAKTRKILDEHVAFSRDSKALGVHFRSGDMRWAPDHPTPPSRKLMIRLIAEELDNDPSYSTLFVASEDKGFVQLASKIFSGLLPVVTSPRFGGSGEFSSRLAREIGVLIDSNNLSLCSTIIHSPSNVAAGSQVIGRSRPLLRKEVRLGSNHKRLPISVFKGLVLFELLANSREKHVEVKEYRTA